MYPRSPASFRVQNRDEHPSAEAGPHSLKEKTQHQQIHSQGPTQSEGSIRGS